MHRVTCCCDNTMAIFVHSLKKRKEDEEKNNLRPAVIVLFIYFIHFVYLFIYFFNTSGPAYFHTFIISPRASKTHGSDLESQQLNSGAANTIYRVSVL